MLRFLGIVVAVIVGELIMRLLDKISVSDEIVNKIDDLFEDNKNEKK